MAEIIRIARPWNIEEINSGKCNGMVCSMNLLFDADSMPEDIRAHIARYYPGFSLEEDILPEREEWLEEHCNSFDDFIFNGKIPDVMQALSKIAKKYCRTHRKIRLESSVDNDGYIHIEVLGFKKERFPSGR